MKLDYHREYDLEGMNASIEIEHKKWGTFKIIKVFPVQIGEKRRCVVRFDRTGAEYNVGLQCARKGRVRDYQQPSAYGVGIIFQRAKSQNPREYALWRHMLMRCYCPHYLRKRPSYEKCSVVDRWLEFRNFLHDISEIPGYADWMAGGNVHLDKDLLFPGNTEYRPGRVQFISAHLNVSDGGLRGGQARSSPVIRLCDGKRFPCIKAAARATSDRAGTISDHCRGVVTSPRWAYDSVYEAA